MSEHAKIELGRQAKALLSNPAFEEAKRLYRDKCVQELEKADPLNIDLVSTLKRHLTTLTVVVRNLETLIDDGKVAQSNLDFERQNAAQRLKNGIRRVVNG